jgi:DNA replication and repair protein RecF
MRLLAISLDDYRSWHHFTAEFESGVTVLVGRNGVGKTNIAEAIVYLSRLGSHRVTNDSALVRSGCLQANIRARARVEERDITAEVILTAGKASVASVNGNKLTRSRELLGLVRVVLFSPEDLDLVRRDPAVRRAFVDELLVARYPRFASVMADFSRALKQRASLLKSAPSAMKQQSSRESLETTLDVWDVQFAPLAARMLLGRLDTLRVMQGHLETRHAQISDSGKNCSLVYEAYNSHIGKLLADNLDEYGTAHVSEAAATQAYLADLAERRGDELRRGVGLVGPQRDDVTIMLGEHPAKGYASHGEMWSVVLAMKLGCFDVLREHHRDDPVLILDDVFAELDVIRRERLAGAIEGVEQVIITVAVADDVPRQLASVSLAIAREGGEADV